MAKHTPGPWRLSKRPTLGNGIEGPTSRRAYDNDDGYRIVAVAQTCGNFESADDEMANERANMHLIAAAPDMLHALVRVRARMQRYRQYDEEASIVMDEVHAAIAKARGDSL